MRVLLIPYSHSIVPGGFEVISYTTLATPLTSLIIREEILFNNLSSVSAVLSKLFSLYSDSLLLMKSLIGRDDMAIISDRVFLDKGSFR